MSLSVSADFSRLLEYLKAQGDAVQKRTEDSQEYRDFLHAFPLSRLNQLTLDEYCVGKGDGASFCWWIERGLVPVLGRYMPGTARGHILYYQRDGALYKVGQLRDYSDEDALRYTLGIQSAIAAAEPGDMLWVDDDNAIYERAGVERCVTVGDGRKLRLLACYHPADTLPISSSAHLAHFLSVLGCSSADIPGNGQPVARMLKLREYFELARERVPNLSPYGFMRGLYDPELGLAPVKDEASDADADAVDSVAPKELPVDARMPALNQILFGPPGTGKTFTTINEALRILAPEFLSANSGQDAETRRRMKAAFDRLVADERIRFVTFHQSFSYEDFIEGLRARTDEVTGQLRYDVVDGVFKSLCEAAASKVTRHAEAPSEVGQRRVWKMSLGNTLGDDASIFQECINGGYALLGYGGGINFAGCTNRQQVQARFAEEGVVPGNPGTDYGITSVTAFVAKMKVGDLIVVSDGNFKFRAIGEVTGDYQFKPHSEFDADYSQMRPVRWLRHYQPSLPHSELLNAQFSQMTLYELRAPTLNQEKLERLLGASTSEGSAENDARVLIIDEINRGSVSRIFGELITLIEESKRAGRPEALPVVLPYSQTRFTVPDNLYIIGTMNSTDRSLAGLDIALRRRFVFKEMPPRPELLDDVTVAGVNVGQLLRVMNQRIEVLLDRDHCLGHAYFMPLADDSTIDRLANIFRNQILPLLQEYFFEDWQRIGWVLNDHRKAAGDRFIQQKSGQAIALFGPDVGEGLADGVWALNEDAFERQEAYLGIIDASRLAVEPEVKRQASHGDFVLRELMSGTIELLHNGKLKQPVLPVLRELASDAGIDIQNANGNDLNTRTLGSKLITHLSNGG